MAKHYVTFGQGHAHNIKGKLLHPNTVARFEAKNAQEGREKAFEVFGSKFCFEYHENEWNEDDMKYFPNGYTDLRL